MTTSVQLLLTCEHGGNQVPADHAALFEGFEAMLETHRGWDIGALSCAQFLARRLKVPLISSVTTRLLVDLNRSLSSPTLFSEPTGSLTVSARDQILADHYHPHRRTISQTVAQFLDQGKSVYHLAMHSFTPTLQGEVRNADIGLLFDPKCPREVAAVAQMKETLLGCDSSLRVRLNYPYLGTHDGVTLAERCKGEDYLGLEVEINQALPLGEAARWQKLQEDLLRMIEAL